MTVESGDTWMMQGVNGGVRRIKGALKFEAQVKVLAGAASSVCWDKLLRRYFAGNGPAYRRQ